MAAAALVRSVTSKVMSRAAAPTHHRSLFARGLHGTIAIDVIQQGTVDVSVSAGMVAATGLGSVAGRLTTKMAHAPPSPPPPYHRLVHGRGIHSRTSPDPIPSTPKKVLDALDMVSNAAIGVGCIALFASAIYMHFWVNPKLKELKAMFQDLKGHGNTAAKGTRVIDKLGKEAAVKMMHSHENRVKKLEATNMDLKAENAELKMALDSARSQGKA